MKILVFGGQKSGKTAFALEKIKTYENPYYIATYDNSYHDEEMEKRVLNHQKTRDKKIKTLEIPLNLDTLEESKTYIIDCVTMWLLNMITKDLSDEEIIQKVKKTLLIKSNFIFILNDTNSGVTPIDSLSRRFVDLTGIIGQIISKDCKEVYEIKFGIAKRIK